VGILFLEVNGFRFTASQEDAARAVLHLASGNFDEGSYAAFLHANSSPLKK
jgi:death-on-curing protein